MSSATIADALADKQLLGAALGSTETWSTWLAALKAGFGIPLNRAERRAFTSIAGSRKPPRHKVKELWALCGRGSGKSRMSAAIAVFLACFFEHDLDPGEVGYVLCLAASRDQAQLVFSYAMAFLRKSPILRQMIKSTTAFEIRLNNGVTIAIHTNSFRLIRGKTLLACVFDEIAFWRDDVSANPDVETYRAVRPSLARTDGMLIGISSPYRRSGLIYSKFRDHYDVEDAFTACIGHCEGPKGKEAWTGDVVRGRLAPFDPRAVAEEYAALARSYGCTKITGDAFAGEWVAAAFRDCGMRYEVSPLTKSSLYLEALPFFNRGAVHIPDHGLLLRELRGLERRVHRSGKDSVDHGARGSDDHANAVCGALYLAIHASRKPKIWINGKSPEEMQLHLRGIKYPPDNFRFIHIDEQGNELTPEQALAIRNAPPGQRKEAG